ncbi:hypothetical protein KL86DPRO_20026 [uncultured delta proteobacterium]|uniref:Uncharacterized protein n=1 Tax=uncultured delta proteobacterium TaxID=34034 RepID=A0A212JTJ9_9DELT|nr:hypothetical protein KL86DPRO_20026 [uncultured delta proteobacterium]
MTTGVMTDEELALLEKQMETVTPGP